jgi:hypothetical protein
MNDINYSLSNEDILRITNNGTNIISYPELKKYNNIDDIFINDCCTILYETRKSYGHWVCLIKHDKNNIEFFDSYGKMPDEQLKYIPEYFRKKNGQQHSLLTYLLLKSGCKIEYNHDKLQCMERDISTCGRWISLRILLKDWKLKDFVKSFKSSKCNSDKLVTVLTSVL